LSFADPLFEGHLIYEEVGDVAVITYDRPERRNALSFGMYRAIETAIEKANASEAVGAIVITHTGPIFCSGIDLKAPPEPKDPETGIRPSVAVNGMANDTSWVHLLQRSKPTVIALNGPAVGLGATHALAADMRIGAKGAGFTFPFLERGTMPEFGATALLPRIVGFAAAMELCLTNAKLDAQQSLARGLLSRVTEGETAREEAIELASAIAKLPRLQVRLTRQMLHDNFAETDWNTVMTNEREAFITMIRAMRAAKAAEADKA
jgi:enoyl-CoA hydratase/carnithine racemase